MYEIAAKTRRGELLTFSLHEAPMTVLRSGSLIPFVYGFCGQLFLFLPQFRTFNSFWARIEPSLISVEVSCKATECIIAIPYVWVDAACWKECVHVMNC
jgi:hypothetical protein